MQLEHDGDKWCLSITPQCNEHKKVTTNFKGEFTPNADIDLSQEFKDAIKFFVSQYPYRMNETLCISIGLFAIAIFGRENALNDRAWSFTASVFGPEIAELGIEAGKEMGLHLGIETELGLTAKK